MDKVTKFFFLVPRGSTVDSQLFTRFLSLEHDEIKVNRAVRGAASFVFEELSCLFVCLLWLQRFRMTDFEPSSSSHHQHLGQSGEDTWVNIQFVWFKACGRSRTRRPDLSNHNKRKESWSFQAIVPDANSNDLPEFNLGFVVTLCPAKRTSTFLPQVLRAQMASWLAWLEAQQRRRRRRWRGRM